MNAGTAILLIICTLIATEAAMRCDWQRRLNAARRNLGRAFHVMGTAAISDHHKEKAVPALAMRALAATLALTAYFLIVLLPFVAAAVIADSGIVSGLDATALFDLPGIGIMTGVSIVYFLIRRRFRRA